MDAMARGKRQLAIRFDGDDMKRLEKIQARYNVKSFADAVRVAINETVRKIEAEGA